ncbi:MAG: hypothetical protein K8W52_10215 [Deltaproteobacteria bacterium]|nr:hypothetical protein [Deltaproteobacteria bacterium]
MTTEDDDAIAKLKVAAKFEPPLTGIEETRTEWLLGQMHVSKLRAEGGTSWRTRLTSSSRFHTRATLADVGPVIGVFLRVRDALQDQPPIEHLAGWVPAERGADAIEWMEFLNQQIRVRVAEGNDNAGLAK